MRSTWPLKEKDRECFDNRKKKGASEIVKKMLTKLDLHELISVSEELSRLMHGLCDAEDNRRLKESRGLIDEEEEEHDTMAEVEEEKCDAEGDHDDGEVPTDNSSVFSRWVSGFM